MSMPFLGKWSFGQGGSFVLIDSTTGLLSVGAAPSGGLANFNAYGTTSGFLLQAMNGKYVTADGTAYAATEARGGKPNTFALQNAGSGAFRVVDLGVGGGGPGQVCWNNSGGALGQAPTTGSPPATTAFSQAIITVGLQDFPQFSSQTPDLSWAYLEGANLSQMPFSQANFSNADLTNATLTYSTFSTATMSYAILRGVKASYAHFDSATMNNVDLTGATLTGATLNQTKLPNATLVGANLNGAMLNSATVTGADLTGATLTGFGTTVGATDFTGSNLTGVDFTGAGVINGTSFVGANLTGAKLSNPSAGQSSIIMQTLKIDSKTNFTAAQIRYLDFTGFNLQGMLFPHADLTGCKLDKTQLNNADLSFADLTGTTLTGGVPLFGTNLSNATLTGADLTGAQLGSISKLFAVPSSSADYTSFLTGLTNSDPVAVTKVFADDGVTLAGTPTITASISAPGRVWAVQDQKNTYTVRLETIAAATSLNVYLPATAAVLANAFMKGAILTSANLYNVRASGVQLYGKAKLDGYAILEGAQFDNANLADVNLEQASLYGVNFDFALLTGAEFQGAYLTIGASGGQATFIGASLQGAVFTGAHLDNVIFTGAAISVAQANSNNAAGVWLFSLPPQQCAAVLAQIAAASNIQNLFSLPLAATNLLKPGLAPASLISIFGSHGITLGATAIVTIVGFSPYWKVTDGAASYTITQGCNQNQAVPALGVASGTSPIAAPTFYIPLSLESSLQSGPVPADVRAAFLSAGQITLSANAQQTLQQQPTDWQVVDVSATYSLWQGLAGDCSLQISVQPSVPAVIQAFTNNSTPLGQRTTVSVPSPGTTGLWTISNDVDNPFNPVTNYIEFNAIANAAGGLDIYGSVMRIQRLSSQGQSEYYNVNLDVTTLGPTDVADTTICPNSMTVATNKADKIPPIQWMRARVPPRAPFCIPSEDGYYFCPN